MYALSRPVWQPDRGGAGSRYRHQRRPERSGARDGCPMSLGTPRGSFDHGCLLGPPARTPSEPALDQDERLSGRGPTLGSSEVEEAFVGVLGDRDR